jgi:phenylacetate-CoA ligase
MSDVNMAVFIEKLQEFKPKYLSGIPSAIEILARYIQRNNIQDIQIDGAIFCLGEALYPWQRDLIESQFKCKIFSEYGMSEHAADAVECEEHQGYHVSMEYCIFELFDKDNQPINQAGVLGKVVGTGLLQYTMPFIRYLTDDLASFAAADCPCGRELTLIEDFKGRSREFFVSKSGKLVPVQFLWTGRDPVWSKIKEMNFLQEVEGKVIARIVKSSQFAKDQIEEKLYEEMYKVLGEDEFNIEIAFVDELPITTREVGREIGGKLSILEQRLPIGFEDFN